ncbi:unnamed protein product [Brugia timori]|uniref:Nuclear receptor domain-containing protein n=1 Tax=Brugia timori TaxID=42155 RepID=A0A0R3RD64_9BILA|nr:unnamed protein product [Brugia timori]
MNIRKQMIGRDGNRCDRRKMKRMNHSCKFCDFSEIFNCT